MWCPFSKFPTYEDLTWILSFYPWVELISFPGFCLYISLCYFPVCLVVSCSPRNTLRKVCLWISRDVEFSKSILNFSFVSQRQVYLSSKPGILWGQNDLQLPYFQFQMIEFLKYITSKSKMKDRNGRIIAKHHQIGTSLHPAETPGIACFEKASNGNIKSSPTISSRNWLGSFLEAARVSRWELPLHG